MAILCVSDPLESGRQFYSDGGDFIARVARESLAGPLEGFVQRPSIEQLRQSLPQLSPETTRVVIFASNSLRHPDSPVRKILQDNTASIRDYLRAGGGVLILHQYLPDVPVLDIPEICTVRFSSREGKPVDQIEFNDDQLLWHVPHDVSSRFWGNEDSRDQLSHLTSWLQIHEETLANLKIVARSSDGAPLVAVSLPEMPGRLAVCAVPLDWHRWHEPLANLIRYAAAGAPRILVWDGAVQAQAEASISRALDQLTAARWSCTQQGTSIARVSPQPPIHLVPEEPSPDQLLIMDEVLERGATIIQPITNSGRLQEFRVRIGDTSRDIAKQALTDLSNSNGLQSLGRDPYPWRNIVTALHYFKDQHPEATPRHLLKHLPQNAIQFQGMTVTSLGVAAQCLYLSQDKNRLSGVRANIRATGTNDHPTTLMVRAAIEVLAGLITFGEWVETVCSLPSMHSMDAIRVLDWLSFFELTEISSSTNPRFEAPITAFLEPHLRNMQQSKVPLSPESRASIVLGLCSLRLDYDQLAHFLPEHVIELRNWYSTPRTGNDMHVSQQMRAAQALARAERLGPFALQNLGESLAELTLNEAHLTRLHRHELGSSLAARNTELQNECARHEATIKQLRLGHTLGMITSWALAFVVTASLATLIMLTLPGGRLNDFVIPGLLGCLLMFAVIAHFLQERGLAPQWALPSVMRLQNVARKLNPLTDSTSKHHEDT